MQSDNPAYKYVSKKMRMLCTVTDVPSRPNGEISYFFVTSHGLSATTWLAYSLNLHPAIFCSHGRSHPEQGLEREEYLRDKAYRLQRIEFERRQMLAMTLGEYLEVQRQTAGMCCIVGNVHGYVLKELKRKLANDTVDANIRIANLVRNPVAYAESYVALVCRRRIDYPEKYQEHLDRAKENIGLANDLRIPNYNLNDPRRFAFLEACWSISGIAEDLSYKDVPHFRMEDIVSDTEYFMEAVNYLTNGKCVYDQALLEKVFSKKKMNSHREIARRLNISGGLSRSEDPEEIYIEWPDWKKEVFLVYCRGRNKERFESAGYDLSFLEIG